MNTADKGSCSGSFIPGACPGDDTIQVRPFVRIFRLRIKYSPSILVLRCERGPSITAIHKRRWRFRLWLRSIHRRRHRQGGRPALRLGRGRLLRPLIRRVRLLRPDTIRHLSSWPRHNPSHRANTVSLQHGQALPASGGAGRRPALLG